VSVRPGSTTSGARVRLSCAGPGPGDDYICDSGQRYGRYECYGDRPFVIFRDYLPDRDRIFGGTGDDRITVGPKADVVRAGSGDDRIDARDTVRDVIACGPGRDVVEADLKDRVRDCERVLLPEV
jgi:Ca2+-binding RTX toxin-like protein